MFQLLLNSSYYCANVLLLLIIKVQLLKSVIVHFVHYLLLRNASDMFDIFSLAYPPPPKSYFANPPPDDVTFGKMAFRENVGGLRKNSELLPRSWDIEEFRAFL